MLTNLQIENFRCFKSLNVPLKPFTVLIGPNDTGKSVFLAALEMLSADSSQKRLKPDDVKPDDHYRRNAASELRVVVRTDDGVQIQVRRFVNDADQLQISTRPLRIQKFQLPNSGVVTECSGYSQGETGELDLTADGSRLAALLDHLLRADRKRFFAMIEQLKTAVPGLEDVEISTPVPERRRIEFIIERGFKVSADRVSAGVRHLLFITGLLHHPNPPDVILLEEPENGIHPRRLREVVQFLREISHRKRAAQVIVTTHSPYLLDCVNLDEDQVLVFQRSEDGSRTATPVDAERLKTFLDEFMLGEVWFNEQEAGLLPKGSQ